MMPENIVITVLGSQVAEMAGNASWSNVLPFGLAVVSWVVFCPGVQLLVMRLTREQG
jgi:phospholipase D1/2